RLVPRYLDQGERQERVICSLPAAQAPWPQEGQRRAGYFPEVSHWSPQGCCRCLDDERLFAGSQLGSRAR
ncbi:hypothetical protein BN1708_019396, partial [Verticillium longisporum]